MEVRAYLVADPQSLELVKPGEGSFNDPTGLAEAGAVGDAATGEPRSDTAIAKDAPVLVVVVAPVSEEPARTSAGPAAQTANGRDCFQER